MLGEEKSCSQQDQITRLEELLGRSEALRRELKTIIRWQGKALEQRADEIASLKQQLASRAQETLINDKKVCACRPYPDILAEKTAYAGGP